MLINCVYLDFLGSAAFTVVQSDLRGNIAVDRFLTTPYLYSFAPPATFSESEGSL